MGRQVILCMWVAFIMSCTYCSVALASPIQGHINSNIKAQILNQSDTSNEENISKEFDDVVNISHDTPVKSLNASRACFSAVNVSKYVQLMAENLTNVMRSKNKENKMKKLSTELIQAIQNMNNTLNICKKAVNATNTAKITVLEAVHKFHQIHNKTKVNKTHESYLVERVAQEAEKKAKEAVNTEKNAETAVQEALSKAHTVQGLIDKLQQIIKKGGINSSRNHNIPPFDISYKNNSENKFLTKAPSESDAKKYLSTVNDGSNAPYWLHFPISLMLLLAVFIYISV